MTSLEQNYLIHTRGGVKLTTSTKDLLVALKEIGVEDRA